MIKQPRILLFGSSGQVGTELKNNFPDIIACDRTMVDFAAPDALRALVRKLSPDIIINASAYTAVDRAESEPDVAMAINAKAPGILAEEALRTNALLVHYSTDYVFDGSKAGPWVETDKPHPLNIYGASKLAGEEAIQNVGGKFLILRTSWVYGPHGHNFLFTMLRIGRERESLNIVDDQIGAPTTSIELARATHRVIDSILEGGVGDESIYSGIYHMSCAGAVSWCGFAQAIFARAGSLLNGKNPSVNPISSRQYPTPARRPLNSLLCNEKLHLRFGVRLANWESALDECMYQGALSYHLKDWKGNKTVFN